MKIEKYVLGPFSTNCYFVQIKDELIIIDPADNAKFIIEKVNNRKVVGILVTHHHFDHVGALTDLEDYYKIKHNGYASDSFEILKVPGHTDDSIAFYFEKEKAMFSGDFIFYHTIGRYDFENSSYKQMKDSLKFISQLPDDIIIYPGHGNQTTLKEEKQYFNSY